MKENSPSCYRFGDKILALRQKYSLLVELSFACPKKNLYFYVAFKKATNCSLQFKESSHCLLV